MKNKLLFAMIINLLLVIIVLIFIQPIISLSKSHPYLFCAILTCYFIISSLILRWLSNNAVREALEDHWQKNYEGYIKALPDKNVGIAFMGNTDDLAKLAGLFTTDTRHFKQSSKGKLVVKSYEEEITLKSSEKCTIGFFWINEVNPGEGNLIFYAKGRDFFTVMTVAEFEVKRFNNCGIRLWTTIWDFIPERIKLTDNH